MAATAVLQRGSISVTDYRCTAGPADEPFVELHNSLSLSYVRKSSFGYRARGESFGLVAGAVLVGHPGDEYMCTHDHAYGDECLSFHLAPAAVDVGVTVFVGFLAGYMVLQYADVRAAYSSKVAGRALAVFNMAMFLGVALMQWVCGLSDSIAKAHNADPFVAVFVTVTALLVAGTLVFTLFPWPDGEPGNETKGLKPLATNEGARF